MERRAAWCAFSVVNTPPNCRTKTRQIAERKSAKLPNKNRPNCRIENFLLYLCLKTKYIVAYEKGVST
jgi:hypothetical protein